MATPVPLIYTKDQRVAPASWWARCLALGLALGSMAMLVVGARLEASPGGMSTHTQLGLAPCQFPERMGIPCPSCGYTTAVSHFAHARPLTSFYTQPMGMVIALMGALTVWTGLYVTTTGRPVYRMIAMVSGRPFVFVMLVFAIGGWGWKILTHINGWTWQ